jgi:uncharacterized protein (UPF0303 family)
MSNNRSLTNISLEQRKIRVEKLIKQLDKIQMFEIFKIIRDASYRYTQNKNGILINITNMKEKLFSKIENYINFSVDNNKFLKSEEEKIEAFKNLNVDNK